MLIEHTIYSLLPKHLPKTSQGIREAGRAFLMIPGKPRQHFPEPLVVRIPQPDNREAHRRGPFGSFSYDSAGIQRLYQNNRKQPPQLGHRPDCTTEETMKRVVRPVDKQLGKSNYSGNGSPGGAKYPAADKGSENICCRDGKNLKKLLANCLPGRCNSLCKHTDLHVVIFPLQTSAGWYVCVLYSSSLAA